MGTERDADAFSEIVYRHGAMVFGACQRILKNGADAEEVTQECFLHLAERGKQIYTSLGGWLYTLATRRSLNRLRSDSRRARREETYQMDASATTDASWDDMRELLDEALMQLSFNNRSAVVYRFLEGKTHAECALAMGVSPSTAQYRSNQGVQQLRKALSRRGVAVSSTALASLIVSNAAQAMPAALQNSLGAIAVLGGNGLAAGGASGLQGTANFFASTGWVKPALGIGLAIVAISAAVILSIATEGGGAGPVPEIETGINQMPPPAPVARPPQPAPAGVDVDDSLQVAMNPVPEDLPEESPSPDASPPQASSGGLWWSPELGRMGSR